MKDKLINNFLNKIRLKYPEYTNTKLEEIKYGIESLYLTITKMIILIILSIIFNIKKEFIIFLLLYNGIRIFAFGLHAKKSSWCLISSIIFFIVLPIILKFIIINKFVISILGSILLINYYKYSPADTRKRPIVNVKIRLKYKYLSCIIVIIYLFIALIINNIYISNLLFSAVLLEGLLINPCIYKLFGFTYDNYKNYHV